jgi:tetratricopeptide (TPR) repeat protein
MTRWLACILIALGLSAAARAHAQAPAGEASPEGAEAGSAPATEAGGAPAATPSAADEEAARAHFRMGVDFYRERNFRAALIEFQRAYRTAPHYKLLYNLGQASVELQEYAPAIDYLSGYLRAGRGEIDEARRKEVEQTILELETRIATVTIEGEEGASIFVDDTLIGRAPLDRVIRIGAGRRRFAAQRENGQRSERVLDVAAGDHMTVHLTFEDGSDEPPAVSDDALGATSDMPDGPSPAIPWAIATTAVLAAGATTAAVLTQLAQKDYKDERRRETTKNQLDQLRDDAETKALITDVLLSATLAAGIVTTVLILTDLDSGSEASDYAAAPLKLTFGPGALGLSGAL